ncbi:MAG: ParA family protein [Leptonema sp. (in: bacteria)]
MNPAVLSIANQKGGVGKTTTAIQISTLFAKYHYRTLLIDLDPQMNASSLFVETKDIKQENSIYEILKNPHTIKNAVHKTKFDFLEIIPSILSLSELDQLLAGNIEGFFKLQDALEQISSTYKFIILDCPPNLGMLTLNALLSSQYVVIPLQAAKFSLDGIKIILDTIETLNKKFRTNIQILGSLMTMYDERTTLSKTMLEEMKSLIPVFKTYISRSILVEEAHLMKQPIWEYAPKSKISIQYETLLKEILDAIEKR